MILHKLRARENCGNVDERKKSSLESQIPRENGPLSSPTPKRKKSAAEKLIRKAGHWFVPSSAVKILND
jgi:hypothetical protein